jgi:prepilin-type N-terminal cleavage/methylation domain-containing protein
MNDPRGESGFTLVEVLVALTIVVLSFAVLFKLMATDLDRTHEVRDRTAASSLLQSLLAQCAVAPQPGVTRGEFPGGFSWRLAVAPYDGDRTSWSVDAVTIDATVSWKDGDHTESRSLTTLRVVPKASPQ